MLSERSQSEQTTYYMIPTIWCSGKRKTVETVKEKSVVAMGSRREREGWIDGA